MRPHGRASIDPRRPRALAICQRCGAMYNHDDLRWQFQYGGLRLINLRLLVCQTCLDNPQIQLRTIILPPDPVPIQFALPENYSATDNPLSGIGFSNNPLNAGANIGTLTGSGGLNAAFDGNINKPSFQSASISVSNSSFNTIGKYWTGGMSGTGGLPPGLTPTPVTYQVSSYAIYAPSDQPILSTGGTTIQIQGSQDGSTWTTIATSTTAGSNGESVSAATTGGNFQYHRAAIIGDGIGQISVAQLQLSVANTGQNEQ